MVTRPPLAFSGFSSRRARYEHDRADAPEFGTLIDTLWAQIEDRHLQQPGALHKQLTETGIDLTMPRLSDCAGLIGSGDALDKAQIAKALTGDSAQYLIDLLSGDLAVRDFRQFRYRIGDLFSYTADIHLGAVADYIPELAKTDPASYGLSICTIDGQGMDFGDAKQGFSLQSAVKPLNYALALSLNGENYVHRHVGREPSGRRFNEASLNDDGLPHNPMINAGAIMCCSMIRPSLDMERRLGLVRRYWDSAIGCGTCGFDEEIYRSELETAERNYTLARLMDEHDAFPEDTDTQATLDLYFRTCALTVDCRGLAMAAAMLANGGVSPMTGHRVADARIVRDTLSLMLSCGMYDFSGEFAFSVGLPAKSGVSGALMIVVPGVCGIGLWSPPLDRQGNPVRGVEFSRQLVDAFPFHIFAGIAR